MNDIIAPKSNDIEKKSGSFQAWQEMYHAINHKSDNLHRCFDRPNLYKIVDIEVLHNKILQIAGTYSCVHKTHTVIISYLNKEQHTCENFAGFKTKVSAITDAIKAITLVYNFLIEHPETKNPHSYRITIDIKSSLASHEEIYRNNFPNGIRFIIRSFEKTSGTANIEYVDYAYAQNFMNVISKWFDNVTLLASPNKVIKFLQKQSQYIPLISKNTFTLLYAYFIWKVLEHYHYYETLNKVTSFLIFSLVVGVVVREIANISGKALERSIDNYNVSSCIDITSGDKSLICKFKKRIRKNIVKIVLNFLSQLSIGIIVTLIANGI